ncbi:MAG: hypothetical protein QXK12_06825 [Candidatus Nezhaarchaeales archaeon]
MCLYFAKGPASRALRSLNSFSHLHICISLSVSRIIRERLVQTLLGIPLVKPYGDCNSSVDMVKTLIDYYPDLSYRAASFKYGFPFMSLCSYWYSLSKA